MNLTLLAVLGVIVMIILIFSGVNIGMAMFIVGFVGCGIALNFTAAFGLLKTVPFSNAFNYSFSVVPLFILMGNLAFRSGISSGLYDAAEKWLGGVRGGLAMATVAACAAFAAICGSSGATSATMGVVAYPEMKKYGYSQELTAGSITAGGTLGILIPPSTAFIIYGITAEQSIGRLFAGGILSGIVLALCYIGAILIVTKRNPALAPAAKKYPMSEKLKSLKGCIGMVILFLIVIVGMFAGFFSATEAAAVGAFFSLVLMFVNRRFSFKAFFDALVESMVTTAMALFIVVSAMIFGYFIAITRLPAAISSFINGLDVNKYVIVFIILAIYIVLGCIMDGLAMLLITVPIFLPVMEGLGFDAIWFGVFLVMVQEMGMMTPPIGMNVYIVAGTLKEVPLQKIFKGIVPFLVAAVVAVMIVIFVPQLATWLPGVLYG